MALRATLRSMGSAVLLSFLLLFALSCSSSKKSTADAVSTNDAVSGDLLDDTLGGADLTGPDLQADGSEPADAELDLVDSGAPDLVDSGTSDLVDAAPDLADAAVVDVADSVVADLDDSSAADLADVQAPADTLADDAQDGGSDAFFCTSKQQCGGPHDSCVGYWQCNAGACEWVCDATCKLEGESVPVVPGAPQCCDNLVKVSCGKPDQNGECSAPCAGASICANCGDGVCGKGENKCNCPQDCDRCTERGSECKSACDQGQTQVDYFCDGKVACCYGVSDCLAQGGSCKVACDNDETKSDTACRDGLACCKPNQACTPLGQGFMGSGTCCPGLTAVPDCDQGANGCACKKCLCYVCLPVKDGVCGPYEHSCNSPDDCPTADKCLPTKQSPCEGTPSGEPAEGVLKLTPQPNALVVELTAFTMNCCRLAELCVQQRVGEIVITVKTRPSYTPCKCICLFSLSTTIDGIRAGIYKVTVYDELAAEPTKPLHSVDAVEIK